MKYLVSFRTTLLISRYLFRSLALLLWLTGALLTIFYLLTVLHQKESVIREQLFSSYGQAQWRATHLAEALRGLKYVSESELNRLAEQDITLSGYRPGQGTDASSLPPTEKRAVASFSAGDRQQGADAQSCPHSSKEWNRSLRILSQYLTAWQNQFASSYEISRFYLLDPQSDCLKTLSFGNRDSEPNIGLRALQKHTWVSDSQNDDQQRNPTYWISRGDSDGTGSYFMSTPVYAENIQVAQLILQQSLRLDESVTPGAVPVSVMLTDRNPKE